MSRWRKLYETVQNNPKNVHFHDLCKLAERFDFNLRGQKGSHRVYTKKGVVEILNFQDEKGKAKPYQVRQFLKIVEKYKLKMERNTDD